MGDARGLREKLKWYLGRGEVGLVEAREIARRGWEEVVTRHRPENRVEEIVVQVLGLS